MRRLISAGLFGLVGLLPATAGAQFTDWAAPVNLGPPVNSAYLDSCLTITKDGLSLYFSSNRQTGDPLSADRDLYVSTRNSVDAPWGDPQPLSMLNTTSWESCPTLSLDEHRLYFTSPRGGGCGGQDMYVSRRHDRRDDLGWEPPVNLGCEIDGGPNSPQGELAPAVFEDEAGRVLLYFSSNRSGNWEFYQSVMRGDDTFAPATLIPELNTSYVEQGITVRRDGLEVIFLSNRPGSASPNWLDFWAATRASTSDPWSDLVHVASLGAPAMAQGKISLSFDGRELYFTSWRDPTLGRADLWVARREKLRGRGRK